MLKHKIKDQSGIGLIETLLALGVGIIVITSMVSLAIYTVRTSLQSKLALEGSQRATQEIELIRAYRDANTWDDFINEVDTIEGCFTNTCYMSSSGSLDVIDGQNDIGEGAEQVTVYFTLTDLSDVGDKSLIRVSVTATWNVGSDTKFAHNYTELSNWRESE